MSPVYANRRAVYYDSDASWVVGLYANALFCRAGRSLSLMFEHPGRADNAGKWLDTAKAWQERAKDHFWSGVFFGMHASVHPSAAGPVDPDASRSIFALGSNAEAILADMPQRLQVEAIYQEAERRRACRMIFRRFGGEGLE